MSVSPFRACRARILRIAWLAVLVIAPTLHAAAVPEWRRPHDYYVTDPTSRNLLKMVEGYHLEQGTRKMERGEYGYARQDFDFILRYFPNDPKALLLMGELAIKTGKPREAVRYFQTAIRMFPDRAATHTAYGVFLHRAGKLRQAIDQYREALKLDPTSAETHYDLGLAYLDIHDYKLANRHAHTAYRLGYPLPGLRRRLQRLGKWMPAPPPPAGRQPLTR